jgi:hypothetical protein
LRLLVTEDGKMLTPDQLEECFPVMTDLQVSKAVEAFYAASGMEPPPVEDAWGKPDVSAVMPHPSDATESKQSGSALPEEPPVNRDTETAVTPPQPDEYEQPR